MVVELNGLRKEVKGRTQCTRLPLYTGSGRVSAAMPFPSCWVGKNRLVGGNFDVWCPPLPYYGSATAREQGRYDMCCPMMSAWDLHKAWPEADFKVIPDAGHSANEPGIAAELVAATEKLKHIKKGQWEDIQKFVPENKQQSSRLGADSSEKPCMHVSRVHTSTKKQFANKSVPVQCT
ncbi:hypothetical protein ACFX15_034355 [Malus domestica]